MRPIPSFMFANVTIGCNLMLLLNNYPLWTQFVLEYPSSLLLQCLAQASAKISKSTFSW